MPRLGNKGNSSLRKQPTFGDATTGFPTKTCIGGETSAGVAKCRLFSQAKKSLDQTKLNPGLT